MNYLTSDFGIVEYTLYPGEYVICQVNNVAVIRSVYVGIDGSEDWGFDVSPGGPNRTLDRALNELFR